MYLHVPPVAVSWNASSAGRGRLTLDLWKTDGESKENRS